MEENQEFRAIRRKDRVLDDQRIEELLDTAEFGYLNLGNSDNGYPYGIPISYAYDKAANAIYIHSATAGQKAEELIKGGKVSFCIVGRTEVLPDEFATEYESVIVYGHVEASLSDEEKRTALMALVYKYSKDFVPEGEAYTDKLWNRVMAAKISIDHITGKTRAQKK
ncbi:pyridoxamine 5'-phosphate oxidase family protein [Dysgonomonas macrotermitis]|uniref:Nitroimidazol reductase NimA, pyridoxamine 5'-phosphate oxidase superfamily n=1 Tax=Dysgonomonas macrotermitis TaxID=1346286 RepID=A0A1M5FPB1_9BACT|nr:pyridoxamine 5'-phosphate oxidase family protein [Dysgonomonas macrotermitis]SHF93336.1 hypothetical protein SAMN05444362_11267 [Dysgonomonas macrotermitis]